MLEQKYSNAWLYLFRLFSCLVIVALSVTSCGGGGSGNNGVSSSTPTNSSSSSSAQSSLSSSASSSIGSTSNSTATWMSYLPKHLEKISPFSWDKPQRFINVRKSGNWTEEQMAIVANSTMVLGVDDQAAFMAKYPNKLYGAGYMNLEKDYGSMGLQKGHFLTNPEHYLYNPDGTPLTGDDCPYYNLANPEMRDFWMSEVKRMVDAKPATGMSFSIDALIKAYDVGSSSSTYVDYWGNPVAQTYREEAIKPLLARMRDEYADKVAIVGNFLRANRPDGLTSWVLDYTHIAYIEHFERPGGGYIENANSGIQYIQQAVAAGKSIQLSLTAGTKPTPAPEMTLEEKRAKASAAMPEFWAQISSTEQDELAEIYAYFDFKLAMFLIAAGEHSYLEYAVTPLANNGGTKLFKIVQPFPEWDMPLGEPLELGKKNGNVWTRRFKKVEVVLDLDNGKAQFLPPGSLPTL